jgi:hypothetical protein
MPYLPNGGLLCLEGLASAIAILGSVVFSIDLPQQGQVLEGLRLL